MPWGFAAFFRNLRFNDECNIGSLARKQVGFSQFFIHFTDWGENLKCHMCKDAPVWTCLRHPASTVSSGELGPCPCEHTVSLSI